MIYNYVLHNLSFIMSVKYNQNYDEKVHHIAIQ